MNFSQIPRIPQILKQIGGITEISEKLKFFTKNFLHRIMNGFEFLADPAYSADIETNRRHYQNQREALVLYEGFPSQNCEWFMNFSQIPRIPEKSNQIGGITEISEKL